jgi:uncharacterized protein YodC (DUF2158 family)
MNKHEFKVGDVVALKSGGPPMTVDKILEMPEGSRGCIACRWFDDKMQLKEDVFSLVSLELNQVKTPDLAALLFPEEES